MKPHGNIAFSWEGDLFVINANGPFNIEGFSQGLTAIKEAIEKRHCHSWNRLEIWDMDAMGSPEVIASAINIYHWYEKNGSNSCAVVVANAVQKKLLEIHANDMATVFTTVEEAKNWLTRAS
jgi:hypothetical protein